MDVLNKIAMQLICASLVFGGVSPTQAELITFSAIDLVGPGEARPNSDASAAAFDLAAGQLGDISIIDFENFPLGSPASEMMLRDGVTYTPSNPDLFSGIYANDSEFRGFNTTLGGSQHLRYSSEADPFNGIAIFSFATPIQAFGAYFTSVFRSVTVNVLLTNRPTQVELIPLLQNGGIQFNGIISDVPTIAAVILVANPFDVFGIDDIRVVTEAAVSNPPTTVSAPTTLALFSLGFVGVGWWRRTKP